MALKHYGRDIFFPGGGFFDNDYIAGIVRAAFKRMGCSERLQPGYDFLFMSGLPRNFCYFLEVLCEIFELSAYAGLIGGPDRASSLCPLHIGGMSCQKP